MIDSAVDMNVLPMITERYSPKVFSRAPITDNELHLLIEAARWAPSSYNEQPWRFIIAKQEDGARFEAFVSSLNEKNRTWAQHAPVLMLSVAARNHAGNDMPNRFALHDVGLAMGNLLMQATSMGMYARMMGGFDRVQAQELLHIPAGYEPVTMVALGHRNDDDPDENVSPPRFRKSIGELAFRGKWDVPLFDKNDTLRQFDEYERNDLI